ncbi:MAG: nitroreductase family deazaflavin-dependent oxidoreductase [Pseudomonadales bacterium]|jgi:deazaflavin-dependent oxidoreductase (nitroreductase family)|nr:nitroreductase family deazaflavin-dependent oxidoreductase [Pseudomonadales bacterium]MBP9033033.1 nitroreductase family deazaflavin-dependent oxidoreductase [Pseudomonadales bacterium]
MNSGTNGAAPVETIAQKVRFASCFRPWMIVLRGRRGLAIDLWLVDNTGFSLMSLQYALAGGNAYTPTMAITMIGAKSGDLRRVALPYVRHGEDYLVIGSNAGGPDDPKWVGNLRKDGRCWLRVKRRPVTAMARIASGEERERLFAHVVRLKPNVARYQQRASTFGREIPIVVISPHRGAAPACA